MTGIQIRNLYKHYAQSGRTKPLRGAVNGLDLEIGENEFFVLLGPSGCGKTTTLRCLAGLEEPSSGAIAIRDRWVVDAEQALFVPPHRRGVGMMFQSYALWPHMSVFQNVAYPLEHLHPRPQRGEVARRVARTLEIVGLEGYETRRPTELSGGQQQRVALARAIVAQPRLRLFDEPLSNLDAQLRARLRQDLRRVHDESGGASVYVTHDQSEALALADRIAIMRLGRLEQLGAPQEIFRSPASKFVAEFLGYENIMPGTVVDVSGSTIRLRADGWGGVIEARSPRPLNTGDRGYAAFRSSALKLAGTAASQAFGEGRLTAISYLGDSYAATVQLGGTPLSGVILPESGQIPGVGQPVFPSLAADDVVILPEKTEEDAEAPVALQAGARR